ncbi:uncharacterized protein LOC144124608 [Amblyomma americanum]
MPLRSDYKAVQLVNCLHTSGSGGGGRLLHKGAHTTVLNSQRPQMTYGTVRRLEKSKGETNWLRFYLCRYWRAYIQESQKGLVASVVSKRSCAVKQAHFHGVPSTSHSNVYIHWLQEELFDASSRMIEQSQVSPFAETPGQKHTANSP